MKRGLLFLTAALLSLCFALVSPAADTTIKNVKLLEDGEGHIVAEWTKLQTATSYSVTLYRGSRKISTQTTTANRLDVTAQIKRRGIGLYSYTIYAVRGGNPEKPQKSNDLDVDADIYLEILKQEKIRTKEAEAREEQDRKEGKTRPAPESYQPPKTEIDQKPRMVTDTDGTEKTAVYYVLLIYQGNYDQDGGFAHIYDVASRNARISNVKTDPPREQWEPGNRIQVELDISPRQGQVFTQDMSIICDEATIRSVRDNGDGSRHVTLQVLPVYKLRTPAGAYIDYDGILRWNPSRYAEGYLIRLIRDLQDPGSELIFKVKEPQLDLNAQELSMSDVEAVEITAYNAKEYQNFLNSAPLRITDIPELAEGQVPAGELKRTTTKVTYRDEAGDKYNGWLEVSGNWYHFTKGTADGPGWFTDTDGCVYYFNQSFLMVTGSCTIDGAEYFFNDGSVEGVPLGAKVD